MSSRRKRLPESIFDLDLTAGYHLGMLPSAASEHLPSFLRAQLWESPVLRLGPILFEERSGVDGGAWFNWKGVQYSAWTLNQNVAPEYFLALLGSSMDFSFADRELEKKRLHCSELIQNHLNLCPAAAANSITDAARAGKALLEPEENVLSVFSWESSVQKFTVWDGKAYEGWQTQEGVDWGDVVLNMGKWAPRVTFPEPETLFFPKPMEELYASPSRHC